MRVILPPILPAFLALAALVAAPVPVPAQEMAVMTSAPADAADGSGEAHVPDAAAPLFEEVTDQTIADFLWLNRLVVVFADTERDPSFIRQLELLEQRPAELAERDVIVLVDTDPAAHSAIRTTLRPRGFALVIVDKDGRVMQRKPTPWDVREITRSIDKTPLRQQELRERR